VVESFIGIELMLVKLINGRSATFLTIRILQQKKLIEEARGAELPGATSL